VTRRGGHGHLPLRLSHGRVGALASSDRLAPWVNLLLHRVHRNAAKLSAWVPDPFQLPLLLSRARRQQAREASVLSPFLAVERWIPVNNEETDPGVSPRYGRPVRACCPVSAGCSPLAFAVVGLQTGYRSCVLLPGTKGSSRVDLAGFCQDQHRSRARLWQQPPSASVIREPLLQLDRLLPSHRGHRRGAPGGSSPATASLVPGTPAQRHGLRGTGGLLGAQPCSPGVAIRQAMEATGPLSGSR